MNSVDLAKQISARIAQIGRDLGLETEDRQGPKVIIFDDLEEALKCLEETEFPEVGF